MKLSSTLSRSSRILLHQTPPVRTILPQSSSLRYSIAAVALPSASRLLQQRTFASTPYTCKGLQPDTSDPVPPDNSAPALGLSSASSAPSLSELQPTKLTDDKYNEIAEGFLDRLQTKLEEKAETDHSIEAEYSAGVMNITVPHGTYVLNKQPPNHQIWLSSPTTGPKRYDWVAAEHVPVDGATVAHAQHEKEGTETSTVGDDGEVGGGKWVYIRDGSTLTDLLKEEIKIDLEGYETAVGEEQGEKRSLS